MTRQWIPIGGLGVTMALSAYMVVQLHAQVPAQPRDFTAAATAQLRDAQGQIVLQGDFMPPVNEDGDVERRASLTATGADADAAGEAEIEFARQAPSEQEIEFSARNLQPGGTFTLVIDGTDVVSAVADRGGEAEAEVEVSIP